ncbi:MAG: YqhA family protein [Candidatus Obscuribacterales bacterium]|nr:YqhA family protein [Candidatus Obscuribacterales bacterium]
MVTKPDAPLQAPSKMSVPMKKLSWFFYHLDAPVFASRWLLYIIHLGLCACLAIYVLKFGQEVFEFIVESPHLEGEQLMVRVLSCIDAAMVANLIVMINIGGYQIFIHRLHIDPSVRPQWLDHLDSMMMKVKVGVSIASITGVQVLRDFMNLEHTEVKLVIERAALHVICLFSAFMFAKMWKMTHDSPTEHQNPPPRQSAAAEHEDGAPAEHHH